MFKSSDILIYCMQETNYSKLQIYWFCIDTGWDGPDLEIRESNYKLIFFISHWKHIVGAQKNRLDETVLLNTQNMCLKWGLTK